MTSLHRLMLAPRPSAMLVMAFLLWVVATAFHEFGPRHAK